MTIKLFNTVPTPKDDFWQVVLLPTITVLRNKELNDSYTVVSLEWLFWSIITIINDN